MPARDILASDLATLVGGELVGSDQLVSGLATLDVATSNELSFLSSSRYAKELKLSNAGVVLIKKEAIADAGRSAICVADPYLAYAKISQIFSQKSPIRVGIDASALIDSSATVSAKAQICAGVVVAAGVKISEGVYLGANTVIGEDCIIGSQCRIEANVTLYSKVSLGERCLIHSGAVIGADGFGFASNGQGWEKIEQLGGVRIGQDVEIGANTTIDRGALSDTVIEDGVKLDNQVQIAHNVRLGAGTAIAGCTAIAGSTQIGKHCTIAGMSGVTGHLKIADGTHITAMTLVSRSITEPGSYSSGTGLEPHAQWKKNVVRFRQLDELAKRVKELESQVKQLPPKD